jgi:hypothetical protein
MTPWVIFPALYLGAAVITSGRMLRAGLRRCEAHPQREFWSQARGNHVSTHLCGWCAAWGDGKRQRAAWHTVTAIAMAVLFLPLVWLVALVMLAASDKPLGGLVTRALGRLSASRGQRRLERLHSKYDPDFVAYLEEKRKHGEPS